MWMELSNHRLSLQTKKIYYDYSEVYSHSNGMYLYVCSFLLRNIQFRIADDLAWFLAKHKQITNERIRPAIEGVLLGYISNLATNLMNKLTVQQIFAP